MPKKNSNTNKKNNEMNPTTTTTTRATNVVGSPPRRMMKPLKTSAKSRRGSPKTPPGAPDINYAKGRYAKCIGPRMMDMD